jgi:hypothetical protein
MMLLLGCRSKSVNCVVDRTTEELEIRPWPRIGNAPERVQRKFVALWFFSTPPFGFESE